MQRTILKIVLASSIVFLLSTTPICNLRAAENTTESANSPNAENGSASTLHETYYVNAQNGLKVRSAPSKDSDVITLLPYGTEIIVTATDNASWYEIEYSNERGYVSASYVTKSSETSTGSNNDSVLEEPDENDSIPLSEQSSKNTKNTFGTAPVIAALIAAIIIMIILALFTAYSFLKKDKENYDEELKDEYDEYDEEESRNHYDENDSNYDNNIDEYDDEYYDDEE